MDPTARMHIDWAAPVIHLCRVADTIHLVHAVSSMKPDLFSHLFGRLERETGERRRGRDILIAVDHGPNSKHAFDWALIHLCRLADTIHLVHAVSTVNNEIVYEASRELMQNLALEALEVAMVMTEARIVQGEAGKVICKEAERMKAAAVVMGIRGRSLMQSVLQGSVSEYCFHNCKSASVVIVPGKAPINKQHLQLSGFYEYHIELEPIIVGGIYLWIIRAVRIHKFIKVSYKCRNFLNIHLYISSKMKFSFYYIFSLYGLCLINQDHPRLDIRNNSQTL
ncbi:uncharacterized protein LOC116129551 [Pistacia vera]|uniref:uncharacterized protein LOC116129551 n=1 Tax=Pistacia vera TaxID=55513 RepID=UPI001262DECD|nr:uncharacterized protein LOC116129551 [Pistacia vera]